MSEKMTPEQSDNSLSPFLEAEQNTGNTLRAWKAGDSNGYQRGKAEEGQRIWEAVKKSQTIAEFFELQKLAGGVRMSELQQIIFGGSDG